MVKNSVMESAEGTRIASGSDSDSSGELELGSELSAATMAALQAHLAAAELSAQPQASTSVDVASVGTGAGAGVAGSGAAADAYVSEDFGMSQFWYDDETAERLARTMLRFEGRLGFISAPTAFRALKRLAPDRKDVFCFEFDRRFGQLWPEHYVFYDCHKPLELPAALHGTFDALVADPPYLNPCTMAGFGSTLRLLARGGVGGDGAAGTPAPAPTPCVLVTGAVLEEEVARVLGFAPAQFEPRHSSNIMNRLLCYCNFEAPLLAERHSAANEAACGASSEGAGAVAAGSESAPAAGSAVPEPGPTPNPPAPPAAAEAAAAAAASITDAATRQ
eukprot:g313.t1